FGSYHAGGVNFVFADGSVRTFDPSISTELLGRLTARNDGKFAEDN
ncbi:MAG: H-X9-DG-CTERM domain-containing protein, partial [Rhodopirellula sp. JB044]